MMLGAQRIKNDEAITNLRAAIEQYEAAEPCRQNPHYAGPRQCNRGTVGCTQPHPAPAVPEGWQLVPKEPTEEMRNAFANGTIGFDRLTSNAYRAMLKAAPAPPALN